MKNGCFDLIHCCSKTGKQIEVRITEGKIPTRVLVNVAMKGEGCALPATASPLLMKSDSLLLDRNEHRTAYNSHVLCMRGTQCLCKQFN